MAEIKLYLAEVGTNRKAASDIAFQVSQKLNGQQAALLQLVQSLDEQLNHEDHETRARALAYLAEVIAYAPSSAYTLHGRQTLVDFLVSRVSTDANGVAAGAVALAIIAMERKGRWDAETADAVMTGLVESVNPLKDIKRPSDRYQVLCLIDLLFRNYREVLLEKYRQNNAFLPEFLNLFEAEKDPRNLMVVFSIVKVPMSEWEVQPYAKQLFELVFNYFPITFRPPPDDPYGITAQDLKTRLRECIGSCSYFSQYAFPALLDKLDSVSINTQRDSLNAILECITNYETSYIVLQSKAIWDGLKSRVINVQEAELADIAMEALSALSENLSSHILSDHKGGEMAPNAFFASVASECEEHLQDAPTKQSKAASQLLARLCAVSPVAASLIQQKIVPSLLAMIGATKSVPKRQSLVEAVAQLTQANIVAFGDWKQTPLDGELPESKIANPLLKHKDGLLKMLQETAHSTPNTEMQYKLASFDGLVKLVSVRNLLSDDDVVKVVNLVLSFLEAAEHVEECNKIEADELRRISIWALVSISRQKPRIIQEQAFPRLLAAVNFEEKGTEGECVQALDTFAQLGREESVFDTVLVRLISRLDEAIEQNLPAQHIQSLLASLYYAIDITNADLDTRAEGILFQSLAAPLVQHAVTSSKAPNSSFMNEGTFNLVGRICMAVVQKQSAEFQQKHVIPFLDILVNENELSVERDETIPFHVVLKLSLATFILAGVRRSIQPVKDVSALLGRLSNLALRSGYSLHSRTAIYKLNSILLNKFVLPPDMDNALEVTCRRPVDEFNGGSHKAESVGLFLSSVRALVYRNEPKVAKYFDEIVFLMEDELYGDGVAHSFAAYVYPDGLLLKGNDCVVSPFGKQKAFYMLYPKLVERVSKFRSNVRVRENYITALAGLVQWVSPSILESELEVIFPVLLQTLDLDGRFPAKESFLLTVAALISERSATIEEYLHSLISRLIKTAAKVESGGEAAHAESVKTKTLAIECLRALTTTVNSLTLIPFVSEVTNGLAIVLDDPSRDVRSVAVRCRTWWADLELGDIDEE